MTELHKFQTRKTPGLQSLNGDYVELTPIDWAEHGAELELSIFGDENAELWTYLPLGPFPDVNAAQGVMTYVANQRNWQTLTITPKNTGKPSGTASYMRLRPEYGSAEIGCVVFGRSLQKTPAATESIYLLASHVFDDLGYRRFEWKCENANEASKNAAIRFGFEFEGIFRHDMIVKGRNRDTAWFSMIDQDWPSLKARFETWLAPENFDADGRQKSALSSF